MISDDGDVAAIGARWGLPVISVQDLPLPEYLIPPPLLAGLENDGEETNASPDPVQAAESPQHQVESKAAEAKATEADNK